MKNRITHQEAQIFFDINAIDVTGKQHIFQKAHLFFQENGFDNVEGEFTVHLMNAGGLNIRYVNQRIVLGQILRGLFRENPNICVGFMNILTGGNPHFKYTLIDNQGTIEVVFGGPGSPISTISNTTRNAANDQLYTLAA